MYLCKKVKAHNLSSVGFGASKVKKQLYYFMKISVLCMRKNWSMHLQLKTRRPRQNISLIPKMDDRQTLEKSLQL